MCEKLIKCVYLSSYTPRINVIRSNFNNKDELIQVVNPSWKGQRFVITQAILKIISISFYKLTMQNIWWARNDTCKIFIKYVAHYPKGLAIFISPHDFWKIYNSFIMMTWWHHQQKQFGQRNNHHLQVLLMSCCFHIFGMQINLQQHRQHLNYPHNSHDLLWSDFLSLYSRFYEVIILESTYVTGEKKEYKCISRC